MKDQFDALRNFVSSFGGDPAIFDGASKNALVSTTLHNYQFELGLLNKQAGIEQNNYKNAFNNFDIGLQQSRMNLNAQNNIRGFSGGLANIISSQVNKSQVAKAQNIQNNYELQELQGATQKSNIATGVNQTITEFNATKG